MNRAIFEGGAGRYAVLGHTALTLDPGGSALPDLPNEGRLRRIVVRAKGPFTFTLDGTDPTGTSAMYALKDEVIVLDSDGAGVRLAGAAADCKIIYLGT